jgi:hypothetical protein
MTTQNQMIKLIQKRDAMQQTIRDIESKIEKASWDFEGKTEIQVCSMCGKNILVNQRMGGNLVCNSCWK